MSYCNGLDEQEVDLLSKRLAYLWNLRDEIPRKYSVELSTEKEWIYSFFGSYLDLFRKSQAYYNLTGQPYRKILEEGERIQFDHTTGEIRRR